MNLKRNKEINDYLNLLNDKCKYIIDNTNKKEKIKNNDSIIIKDYNDYNKILHYNLNVSSLKEYCKNFSLKISGNKTELINRLFSYLYLSSLIIKIQKVLRGKIIRKLIDLHGPGLKDKTKCTNDTDFFTMDELTNIPLQQFFSYKDSDGFIYGFDLVSFNNLIYSSNGVIKNPYNRHDISTDTISNFRKLLRLSKILKINITTKINDINEEVSPKKLLELKVINLFQKMDELGNYTNNQWFMNLNNQQLIKLIRELIDLWNYRAHLTHDIKIKICPPYGRPFINISSANSLEVIQDIDELRNIVLKVLEKFVYSGIDNENKCLGVYYVLGCLTLVSQEACDALPWLFQAFNYSI
jgi:hypothetical protein